MSCSCFWSGNERSTRLQGPLSSPKEIEPHLLEPPLWLDLKAHLALVDAALGAALASAPEQPAEALLQPTAALAALLFQGPLPTAEAAALTGAVLRALERLGL